MLPEIGCKIVSLFDKESDYEWLWQDPHRPVRVPIFGDAYDQYDISGIDECFPNIGISPYPLQEGLSLLDHGEVWSVPWKVEYTTTSAVATVIGRQLNFELCRELRIEGRKIHFQYNLKNIGEDDLLYLWSAHPLFAIRGEMSLTINGHPRIHKEFGFSDRMAPNGDDGSQGRFNEYLWPTVSNDNGNSYDISKISLKIPLADKIVVNTESIDSIKLRDETSGRELDLQFNSTHIPFVGICYNLGAWPPGEHSAKWVALEPTSAPTDRLDQTDEKGFSKLLKPNEEDSWGFAFYVS
ncbi:MAG: hypothetical protein WDO06_07840 [Actinomycetota bacterium]